MCATVQTGCGTPAHYPIVDFPTPRYGATTMKRSLPQEIINVMPSYHARAKPGLQAAAPESARIRGGNWSMQGFRRTGLVHDEDECQLSIAEFMDAQERFDAVE